MLVAGLSFLLGIAAGLLIDAATLTSLGSPGLVVLRRTIPELAAGRRCPGTGGITILAAAWVQATESSRVPTSGPLPDVCKQSPCKTVRSGPNLIESETTEGQVAPQDGYVWPRAPLVVGLFALIPAGVTVVAGSVPGGDIG